MPSKYPDELVRDVLEYIVDGEKSHTEAAEKFGVPRGTISSWTSGKHRTEIGSGVVPEGGLAYRWHQTGFSHHYRHGNYELNFSITKT